MSKAEATRCAVCRQNRAYSPVGAANDNPGRKSWVGEGRELIVPEGDRNYTSITYAQPTRSSTANYEWPVK